MAIYTTTKCGFCNCAWEFLDNKRADVIVGPPVIKCENCGALNKTKKKLFRDLNIIQKTYFIVEQTLFRFIYSSFIIFFGFAAFYFPFTNKSVSGSMFIPEMEEPKKFIAAILFVTAAYFIIKAGYENMKQILLVNDFIKQVEKQHDKNGGYVLSKDFY